MCGDDKPTTEGGEATEAPAADAAAETVAPATEGEDDAAEETPAADDAAEGEEEVTD